MSNPNTFGLVGGEPVDLSGYVPYVGGTETLVLLAGTLTKAPIQMQAGSLLTTPVTGTIEFDGSDFYVTI
jgi:hypothetical protein